MDGDLTPGEQERFEGDLAGDALLASHFRQMENLAAAAGQLEVFRAPEVTLPGGLPWARPAPDLRRRSFLAGAAAASLCLLLGFTLLARLTAGPAPAAQARSFRIVYYAPQARSVSLLGDFNGWTSEIPLMPKGEAGYWLAEVTVEPGEYRYVLIVDGQERTGDPLADYVVDDDFGAKNSVVRIGL